MFKSVLTDTDLLHIERLREFKPFPILDAMQCIIEQLLKLPVYHRI